MARKSEASKRWYCPKCGRKTLQRREESVYKKGKLVFWVCRHAYVSPHERYAMGLTPGHTTRTFWELKRAKMGPTCGAEIRHPDRDAEISDYHGVLDKLVRATSTEPIRDYLLEHYPTIHRKGMEILYSSETLDLVRIRDQDGVAAWIYWKCTWEPGRDRNEIPWSIFQGAVGDYITFNGFKASRIFATDRYPVWSKDVGKATINAAFFNKFSKAQVVKWAQDLEQALPEMMARAQSERARWTAEEQTLRMEVQSISPLVAVTSYDGELRPARIRIYKLLTPEQAKVIAEVLKDGGAQ